MQLKVNPQGWQITAFTFTLLMNALLTRQSAVIELETGDIDITLHNWTCWTACSAAVVLMIICDEALGLHASLIKQT